MQWKSIKGYEGYYEVSNTGIVRGLDRTVLDSQYVTRRIKGRIMKQSESSHRASEDSGYLVVNLRKNSTANVVPVHRLVAEAFLDNPDNLPTVNHKDGNKHNNNVDNLEWASYAENNIHALNMNLRKPRGVKIAQLLENGEIINVFQSVCDASRKTGISRGMISHCINGRANTAGGYYWMKIKKCNDYPISGSTVEDELPLEAQDIKE